MMHRNLVIRSFALLMAAGLSLDQSQAQTVVYDEDFDTAPIQGTSTSRGGSQSSLAIPTGPGLFSWNDTNATFLSPGLSYHAETPVGYSDTVVFETNAFSTVGNPFVLLSFFHKSLVHPTMRCEIYASNNNGTTWSQVIGTHYLGGSPNFAGTNYFNILSYGSDASIWGTNTAPLNATNAQWVREDFNISALIGGMSGFPQVKLRFVFKSNLGNILPPAATAAFDNWFVDDIEVLAAPCEINPPVVSFNLVPPPIPCYDNQPQGSVLSSNTPKFGIDATDASGIGSASVIYRINGGVFDTAAMTLNTGAGPNRYEYSMPIGLLALGDTVEYYVYVEDNSCVGTGRRLPSAVGTYYTFWIINSLPSKCGSVNCGASPTLVGTFPWTENFEGSEWIAGTGTGSTGTTHRGTFPVFPTDNWEISPNPTSSGFGWSIRQGTHPSSSTGPSGDHTTGGGKYVYMETSQTGNPPSTQLITPCIDLRSGFTSCVSLDYWYHKFGNNMGNLRVDVDTGATTALWYNGVQVVAGQTQTSQAAAWLKNTVDLTPFIGKIIRIRFTGTYGNGANGDMAIDDLRIYEPVANDMEMVAFTAPVNGFCSYSATTDVTITVKNLGCVPTTTIPVAFNLNGTIVRDTIVANLALGQSTTFTFGPKANLSAFQQHSISVFTELPGDADMSNNSLGPRTIDHDPAISGFPYILDFDGPTASAGNNTAANPGNIGTTDWSILPANTDPNNFSWYVGRGLTPTNQTGPDGGYSLSNNYLYTEGNNGASPSTAVLISECIDLGTLTEPYFDFFYHLYGANAGGITVQVKPETANTFTTVGTSIATQQLNEFDAWVLRRNDLSAYVGQTIQLRILAQKSSNGSAADAAIDKLQIYNRIANDAGIVNITTPNVGLQIPATTGPVLVIQNYGSTALTSIPIELILTPTCGPGAGTPLTYTATWTGTLAPGASTNYTFATLPAYVRGAQLICAKTNVAGDVNTFNNEFCKKITGFNDLPIPFSTDFESCAEDEHGFVLTANPSPDRTYRLWSKANGTGAQSGTRWWKTNPNGNYRESSVEILRFPRFFGFDSIQSAEVRFWMKFNLAPGDAARLEYFSGGQWQPVGDANTIPGYPNWYSNTTFGTAASTAFSNTAAWEGNTGGWVLASYPLLFQNNQAAPLALRLIVRSDASSVASGFEIDGVEIYVPPQYSAAPIDARLVANLPVPGTNQVMARIENTGARPLDSCEVSVWIDGTFLASQQYRFSPPLQRGQSRWDTIQVPWLNSTSGQHNICMRTRFPNGRLNDDLPSDDSLCDPVVILNVVSNLDTNGYCDNFDNPALPQWLTLNYATYADGLTFWEKGTPGQANLSGAFSGPNAWMTRLSQDYRNRDSSALFTPAFAVDSASKYRFEFMHNYDTERFHDGGTIDITMDGGITWQSLGNVQGNWFNTQYITALDVIKPGWSYRSNGWKPASLVVRIPYDGNVIFRFRFGSDQGIQYEGWSIDNFCFKVTNAPVQYYVGLEEQIIAQIELSELYPNPTRDWTRFDFNLKQRSEVRVTAFNLYGQVLHSTAESFAPGAHSMEIPTQGWAKGMYMVLIEVDGARIAKRLLIDR
ncbi:T9SS type A sorting domain-containing protein [bacterium]|nr:T9SS type A sorting domain-containing protein [bacterium]